MAIIPKYKWNDSTKSWNLAGTMVEAMFKWLNTIVHGSTKSKGWQLAGTMNPDDPNPANFKPPDLPPSVMTQGYCAWAAGASQDFMFEKGMAPLVRIHVDEGGNLVSQSGADVKVTSVGGGGVYTITVVDKDTAQPVLTNAATVSLTLLGLGMLFVVAQPIVGNTTFVYSVFGMTTSNPVPAPQPAGAYIHFFA